MYTHNLDPVLFNFYFIELRWYSLAYILGIVVGWWLSKIILDLKVKNKRILFNVKDFDDLISNIIISIIIGGRIGYVIFYNFKYYLNNPIDILKIWEGGMSFHGALLGIIIGVFVFTRNRKISTFVILDVIASVAPIGIFFGRIANFINAELYGKPSDFFWSVIFPTVDTLPRHPSQIYEAFLEGIILFVILISLILNNKIRTGICSSFFLILYGIFRIFSEQFREPDIQIGYIFNFLTMGSVLSIIMIISGIFLLIKFKNDKN